MRQMTIWDYLERKALSKMTEEEMVEEVEKLTGLTFKPNPDPRLEPPTTYEAKKGRLKLAICLDTYSGTDTRFIGVDWFLGTSGGGFPADTIEEAESWLRKRMEDKA
jgi:hypothetical protein